MHSTRDKIIEVVNKLFIYTDSRQWDELQNEVFTEEVFLDMTSLGGKAEALSVETICEMWDDGFRDLDAVNHLAGNYLVKIQDKSASVFAYATATHYKESATKGKTREFVGTYDLQMIDTEEGWRIDRFKYNLKYMNGNLNLD